MQGVPRPVRLVARRLSPIRAADSKGLAARREALACAPSGPYITHP